MTDLAGPGLAQWQNFDVIVGSSAAALIGIQRTDDKPVWEDRVRHAIVPCTAAALAAAV